MCDRCVQYKNSRKGWPRFRGCVRMPGYFKEQCGCCLWDDHRCSLRSDSNNADSQPTFVPPYRPPPPTSPVRNRRVDRLSGSLGVGQ
jgi:hypothetical protein